MHDLDALLAEVDRHFDRAPEVQVCWASAKQLRETVGTPFNTWGLAWRTSAGRFIGINLRLKCAPRYVLKYLIFHERLHTVSPPRVSVNDLAEKRTFKHHRAFRLAERVWPDYVRANAWLDANESRVLR